MSTTPRSSRAAAVGSGGASESAEMTATPSAPARMVSAALPASIPAMAQSGKLPARRRNDLRDARKPGEPDRLVGIVLRGRDVDPADTDIVEQFDRRGLRPRNRVDREPDDRIAAQQAPRIRNRHVALPDMHAVGTRHQRHVDTIVDHQRHPKRRERRLDRAGALDHHAGVARLVAELHQGRSALG